MWKNRFPPGTSPQSRAVRARRWNEALGKIAVSGGSEDEKTIFYTALYRSLCGMADITEDGKYYSGYDKQVHASRRARLLC